MFKRKSKSPKAPKAKKEKRPKKPREKRARKAMDIVALKKQPTDIYMVLLMVSLAALLVGIFVLGAELATYTDQGFFKGYPWWKAG